MSALYGRPYVGHDYDGPYEPSFVCQHCGERFPADEMHGAEYGEQRCCCCCARLNPGLYRPCCEKGTA